MQEHQGLLSDHLPEPDHARHVRRRRRPVRGRLAGRPAVRLAGLDPDQRAAIERAIELLTTAAATDNEAERLLAYARARVELAHLERSGGLRLPRAARAALAGAARGELPAS